MLSDAAKEAGWKDGPPPKRDDGAVILVLLKQGTGLEYYDHPVAVTCWAEKLKTTVEPIRINYDDCIAWKEI